MGARSRAGLGSVAVVAAVGMAFSGMAGGALAEPQVTGGEGDDYSFLPGPGPKAHRKGAIKVVVKGIPASAEAEVVIKRRNRQFERPTLKRHRLYRTDRLAPGKQDVFRFGDKPGHFYVVGKPVKAKGVVYKAHVARVVVNNEHGTRVKLRYYHPDHRHHPKPGVNAPKKGSNSTPMPTPTSSAPAKPSTAPSAPSGPSASPTASPSASPSASPTKAPLPRIAFPTSGKGSATSFDPKNMGQQGVGAWRTCKITWSFDPGPTARMGADPQKELQLLRGIFDSITAVAKYQFEEVQTGGQIRIRMLDTLAAIGGVVPSGLGMPVPQNGQPFTGATIDYNAGSLLSPGSLPRTEVRQNLYAHEVGHSLGLNHVTDPDQIMAPTVPLTHGWGAGDIAALKAMPSTCP